MENESRNSEEQSRKLIRIKNQWFVSTESESDSDDSVMIRIRIDTCNTYSTIETWPDSWHSVSVHGHLSPAVRTSGSRNLVGLQWHSLYQHVIWWRRSLSCYLAWRLCWRTPGVYPTVVSLTLIVIGPFQKVGLGQKLQFATRRNKTNQIRIRKRELDASNNRSFASEIVSSDYEVTALVFTLLFCLHPVDFASDSRFWTSDYYIIIYY